MKRFVRGGVLSAACLVYMPATSTADEVQREQQPSAVNKPDWVGRKDLPKLDKRDIGLCLGNHFNVEAEYKRLEKEQADIEADKREIEAMASELEIGKAALDREQGKLDGAKRELLALAENIRKRKSAIEVASAKRLTQVEVNKITSEINVLNADIRRHEIQRNAYNAQVPVFNTKLEQYNASVNGYNERLKSVRTRISSFGASAEKMNETIRFQEKKCSGLRTIDMGDKPAASE